MITITKSKNGVDYITPSKTQRNPDKPRGYFRIEQTDESITASGLTISNTKSMLISGEIAVLEKMLTKNRYQLSGNLFIEEIAENELDNRPDLKNRLNIKPELKVIPISEYKGEEIAEYEKAIEKVVKRTGAEGVVLQHNGNRILRFTSYDPTGEKKDSLLQYTNVEEVSAFRLAERQKEASLPK